ncbi:MAG: FISUMP domain-containing protein [Bacteroidota bacterium]
MKKIILVFTLFAFFNLKNEAQTVSDYEGNEYNIITIGTQKWTKENLISTKYNDGTSIPLVIDWVTWASIFTPGYCWYLNNETQYKDPYGALYNWYTVNTNKLCPNGWHAPTDAEWTELSNYLGGLNIAGGKLKETGISHWLAPNTGATDETGFTAVANGYRHGSGNYDNLAHNAYFWTNTTHISGNSWERSIPHDSTNLLPEYFGRNTGMAVRCIKDTASTINDINQLKGIKIYPNPACDKIYIENHSKQKVKLQIVGIAGECELTKEISNSIQSIDIRKLTKGNYIIRCIGNNQSYEQKILKE